MKLLLRPNCWQLEATVWCLVMVLTAVYVLVGLCGVGCPVYRWLWCCGADQGQEHHMDGDHAMLPIHDWICCDHHIHWSSDMHSPNYWHDDQAVDIPPTLAGVPCNHHTAMLGWRAVPCCSLLCPSGWRGYLHCLSCTLPYAGRHINYLSVGVGRAVVLQDEVQEAGG